MRREQNRVAVQAGCLEEANSIEKCAPLDLPSFLLPLHTSHFDAGAPVTLSELAVNLEG